MIETGLTVLVSTAAICLALSSAYRYGRRWPWRGGTISWAHLQTVRLEQQAADANAAFIEACRAAGEDPRYSDATDTMGTVH